MDRFGGEAAELKDPTNNFGAQSDGTKEPDTKPSDGARANADRVLENAIQRMTKRISGALSRCKSDDARARVCAEVHDPHTAHGRAVADALTAAAALVEELSDRSDVLTWALVQVIERAKTYED
jgi:hypothetical protein